MPLVRMKAAPVKTDGERLGNEFMNGVFFSTRMLMTVLRGVQGSGLMSSIEEVPVFGHMSCSLHS